jgi:hypothetical protein
MFTLVDLGIFVAVCNVLILKVKNLIYSPFILSKFQIYPDNQDTLACRPPEKHEIAKNTVKFFHWTFPVLDTFSKLN